MKTKKWEGAQVRGVTPGENPYCYVDFIFEILFGSFCLGCPWGACEEEK